MNNHTTPPSAPSTQSVAPSAQAYGVLKRGVVAAGTGLALLTTAGLSSVKVAGNVADKAVEITGKSVDVGAKLIGQTVNVVGNVGKAGLNATRNIGVGAFDATGRIGTSALKTTADVTTSALETASVVSQQTAKVTQAVAKATGSISENTLQTSASIVKSGMKATTKIADAAFDGTAAVTVNTLKHSAEAASAGAKFSLSTVTSSLKGLDNLRDLVGITGQAWVEKAKIRKGENKKLESLRTPQVVLELLVKDFEKVGNNLRSSFETTLDASNLAIKLLGITLQDLYCMSFYRRLMRRNCPKDSTIRKSVEYKTKTKLNELNSRCDHFHQYCKQQQELTISLFKADAQRISPVLDEKSQIDNIKSLFLTKLEEFSQNVAKKLTELTGLFEKYTAEFQKTIERAYGGIFSTNNLSGGTRRGTRRARKTSQKSRKNLQLPHIRVN